MGKGGGTPKKNKIFFWRGLSDPPSLINNERSLKMMHNNDYDNRILIRIIKTMKMMMILTTTIMIHAFFFIKITRLKFAEKVKNKLRTIEARLQIQM